MLPQNEFDLFLRFELLQESLEAVGDVIGDGLQSINGRHRMSIAKDGRQPVDGGLTKAEQKESIACLRDHQIEAAMRSTCQVSGQQWLQEKAERAVRWWWELDNTVETSRDSPRRNLRVSDGIRYTFPYRMCLALMLQVQKCGALSSS